MSAYDFLVVGLGTVGSAKASYQTLHIAFSHGIAAACARRRFSKAGDG
jgi:hypothetical protein